MAHIQGRITRRSNGTPQKRGAPQLYVSRHKRLENVPMSEILSIIIAALVSFLVAWATIRAEESKGRAALYSLCCRFFISAFNSIDHNSRVLKVDVLTKKQYVSELAAIIEELSQISSNPFFSRFIARNEYVPQMLVQLRRELTEHSDSSNFALNQGSIQNIIKTYEWCKRLPWGFGFRNHRKTEELVGFFRQWMQAANNS